MAAAETTGLPGYYARSTRRRVLRIIARLRRMHWDYVDKLNCVFLALSQQQAASRKAGFEDTANLCRDLGDCLVRMRIDRLAIESKAMTTFSPDAG